MMVAAALPPRARSWYRATRPRTLTAAAAPVLVGSAAALGEQFSPLRFALALLGAVAIQAGTNMFNEHFDDVQGLDRTRVRRADMVVQTGEFRRGALLRGGVAAMAIGVACGLILVALTDARLLWVGLASVFAGYAYTARPFALGYRALGEVTVFTFMGPVIVVGAYWVQTEQWSWPVALLSLPMGGLVTAILHVNNVRDMADDRANGKRTLANLFGRRIAALEYRLLTVGALMLLVFTAVAGLTPWPSLLALMMLPTALRLDRAVARSDGVLSLDRVMVGTAKLHRNVGLLIALGLALAALLAR